MYRERAENRSVWYDFAMKGDLQPPCASRPELPRLFLRCHEVDSSTLCPKGCRNGQRRRNSLSQAERNGPGQRSLGSRCRRSATESGVQSPMSDCCHTSAIVSATDHTPKFALISNTNCGKTTLLTQVTGARRRAHFRGEFQGVGH